MRQVRQFWLKNPRTGAIWNLTPQDPYVETDGCFMSAPGGVGYEAEIKTYTVMTERFLEELNRKTVNPEGTLHFRSYPHINRFLNFVGDFALTFELHYSPDGSIISEDRISKSWYRVVLVQKFEKPAEKNKYGWYQAPITFTPLSIWKRDVNISLELQVSSENLILPTYYPFYYGGGKWNSDIVNEGIEAPLRIELSNVGSDPEWLVMPEGQEYQRAKFNVNVTSGKTLIVDSSPTNQIAEIRSADYTEPVYNFQAADYDYINFIMLPNGKSTISFDIANSVGAVVKVLYSELKDVI